MRRIFYILMMALPLATFTGCGEDGGINFFTISQDVAFGKQLDSSIVANPTEYKLLDEAQYPVAYTHLK